MYIDSLLMFSKNQSLISAPATILSDKSIDLGSPGRMANGISVIRDIGRGESMQVVAQITESIAPSQGLASVQVKLVTADDGALTSGLTVICETPAISSGLLVLGYQFRLGLVPAGIKQRFLGLQYVLAGANVTAGRITAFLAQDRNTSLPEI